MGLLNGTSAYNMVYGDNPLFVNTINEKENVSTNSIEIVDLPTISIRALMGFANNYLDSKYFIGQLVLFRDKITGTVISTLRDSNCVISEDNYPLSCVEKCIIPSATLNCEDEMFYRESYFSLASQIQKANRESFITIVPVRYPTNKEISTYTNSNVFIDDDDNNDNEICKEACAKLFPQSTNVEKHHTLNTNKKTGKLINEPLFITHNEIAKFGRDKKWTLGSIGLLKRFEGIILFIAQDIIKRLLEMFPQKNTSSIRHVLLFYDGKCHPIKDKERTARKTRKDNTVSIYPTVNAYTVSSVEIEKKQRVNMLRKFLLHIPSCIIIHYLMNVLRVPLVCRIGAKTVFYNRTDWSEAETIMVHMAGYLCNMNIPHMRYLDEKKLTYLDMSSFLSSEAILAKKCQQLYTWNEFREMVKGDEPFTINLYSSDNDVLHKWNLCASHSVALSGKLDIPSYVTSVRFYRTMVKSHSKTWIPSSSFITTQGMQYQMCYELTVTHVPHDIDAGMLLMVLCGSDYNDSGLTFNESLKIVYREILSFKKLACTCHRGWKDYAVLANNNNNNNHERPLYEIGQENTSVCRHCSKVIVRQFWEAKSFFASIICLLMKELDPELLFKNNDNDITDDIARHKIIAINCICNICAFLLLGKFNKLVYGNIDYNESLLDLLHREKRKKKQDTKGPCKSITDSITLASYVVEFDRGNLNTYTAGGIRHWHDEPVDSDINQSLEKNISGCKRRPNNNNDNNTNNDTISYNNTTNTTATSAAAADTFTDKLIDKVIHDNSNNSDQNRFKRPKKSCGKSEINVTDITWCNQNYKILSNGTGKNENFWKCMFDTSSLMLPTIASLPLENSQQIDDDILFQKTNLNKCLTDESFSISNINILKRIMSKMSKKDKLLPSSSSSSSSSHGVSAVNRFIDLILTIYLYIIGEDSFATVHRVPIEHHVNSKTNITIRDMIIECLSLLYSEKLYALSMKKSKCNNVSVEEFMNNRDIITTQKEFQSLLQRHGAQQDNFDNDAKNKDDLNEKVSTVNDVDMFPYTPLLGEARLFTPLTLWTVYLSLKEGLLVL
nr:MAG: wsv139-like protein [Marsupenaeus japonicus endogenous nimavirus]